MRRQNAEHWTVNPVFLVDVATVAPKNSIQSTTFPLQVSCRWTRRSL
jgi:hypothetical protein